MDNNEENIKLDIKTSEFLNELANASLITSIDLVDKLDQKLITLISTDAIIVSILFTVNLINYNGKVLFYISTVFILASLIIGVCGYIPKNVYVIDPDKTWVDYYSYNYDKAIAQVTSNLVEAWKKNRHNANVKGTTISWAFITLVTGIVSLIITIIV